MYCSFVISKRGERIGKFRLYLKNLVLRLVGFFMKKWFNTSFYRKQLNRSLKVDACTTFTEFIMAFFLVFQREER